MAQVITTSPPTTSKLAVLFMDHARCTSNLPTVTGDTNNTGGVVAGLGVVIVLLIVAAVIVVGIIVGVYFWR